MKNRPALLILAATVLAAPAARAEDMVHAVARSLTDHPQMKALNYSSHAAQARVGQAYAGYMPSLDLRAAGGLEHTNSPTTRARAGDGKEDLSPTNLRLTLTQPVFQGFQTKNQVESNKFDADASVWKLRSSAESLALEVVRAYFDVLMNQRLENLARDNVAQNRKHLELVRSRAKSGAGNQADVNKANARLKNAEAAFHQYTGAVAQATARYTLLVGKDPEGLEAPVVPRQLLTGKVEDDIQTGLKHSPVLAEYEARVRKLESQRDVTTAAFYPKINLEVTSTRDYDIDGTRGLNESLSTMLVMNYNLLSGTSDLHKVREAKQLLGQAMADLDLNRRNVVLGVRNAFAAWETTKARQAAFDSQVQETRVVRDAFTEQYKVGQRTLTDLLDAEEELFKSHTNQITENTAEQVAVYQLLSSQGRLLEVLGIEMPEGAQLARMGLGESLRDAFQQDLLPGKGDAAAQPATP
ncbi:MAG: TolC family outer membrane protein [Magnetococcales bacterium]|nr:TolC family outer membrane protein [Magnetococcales bacterium]